MKPALLFLIPIAIGAGFVVTHQMRDSPADSNPESPPTASSDRPTTSARSKLAGFDWPAIADDLTSSQRSHEQLKNLTADELRTALRQTESAIMDPGSRRTLRKHLLILLINSDPESLLTDPESADLVKNIPHNWRNHAIAEWTRQSPSKATTWLDSLSGQSFPEDQLITLKRHHFSSLIIADFEAAKTRLQETPKNQRNKMIENYDGFGSHWTEDDVKDHNLTGRFADLIRTFSTAGSNRFITFVLNVRGSQDRPMGIGKIQTNLKDWKRGYRTWVPATTVADFFDKISATPEEQKLCLDEVARQFKYYQPSGDVVTFRESYLKEIHEARAESN